MLLFSSCASRRRVESMVSHQITQSQHIETSDKAKTVYELVTVTHFLRDSAGADRVAKTEEHRRVLQENEKTVVRDSLYIHVRDTVYREQRVDVGISQGSGYNVFGYIVMAFAIAIIALMAIIYFAKR